MQAALKSLGLQPRLPVTAAEVFDFRGEYIKNRNLITLKSESGRPQDLEDIKSLKEIVREARDGE